jgi:tRNA threonylcarbamoyl adenosine modification protein (Sua5/YciO/YrdC/YwlC family)
MKKIHVDDPQVVEVTAEILRDGGVGVIPTDTLYGLSTPLSSRGGYERILVLKKSEKGRRFVYLGDSVEMVERYIGSWGCASKDRLRRLWPASLTAVFAAGERCPHWVGDTIAVRVPDLTLLRSIVAALGELLLSTSVNRAGEPPLGSTKEMEELFGGAVDVMVTGGGGTRAAPSTVVDFTGEKPVLIRRGAYPWNGF